MKVALTRLGALAAVLLWATSASAAGLAPISQIFVFGDSLADTGNAFEATGGGLPPSPTYFNGRVTNGLVWVEPMASDLGVSITNYAVAGAQTGTGNVNSGLFPVLDNTGLQTRYADNPFWVSEGLAVFFETPDLRSKNGWNAIG